MIKLIRKSNLTAEQAVSALRIETLNEQGQNISAEMIIHPDLFEDVITTSFAIPRPLPSVTGKVASVDEVQQSYKNGKSGSYVKLLVRLENDERKFYIPEFYADKVYAGVNVTFITNEYEAGNTYQNKDKTSFTVSTTYSSIDDVICVNRKAQVKDLSEAEAEGKLIGRAKGLTKIKADYGADEAMIDFFAKFGL